MYMARKYVSLTDYKAIVKDVRKANQRIARIQKRYGENAWALNNLYDKLDNKMINAISPYSGEISIKKNMSNAQLNAVRRATKEFLSSKTSTIRGIENVKKEVKEGLKKVFNDNNLNVSDKEINSLYRIVEDKDLRTTAELIGASTLWRLVIDARNKNMNKKEWNDQLKKYNINELINKNWDEVMEDYLDKGNDLDIKFDVKSALDKIYKDVVKNGKL